MTTPGLEKKSDWSRPRQTTHASALRLLLHYSLILNIPGKGERAGVSVLLSGRGRPQQGAGDSESGSR